MENKTLANSLIILSVVAVGVLIYLTYLHYSPEKAFCDVTNMFSCNSVNKSAYSEFPPGSGIPVAILGMAMFLFILRLSVRIREDSDIKKKLANWLFYTMIFNLLFAFYLVSLELFVIHATCMFCIILDLIIIAMLVMAYKLKKSI